MTITPAPAAPGTAAVPRTAGGSGTGRAAASVRTRGLLLAGAVSGPLWAAVSLAQAAARDGFDLTRHPLSMLSTGSSGWVQIVNFTVAGLLLAAGGRGFRRVLAGGPGGVWVPRLVLLSGLGMIAAGVFVMQPADGFGGTPAGPPRTMTGADLGHMAAGSVTFLSLIAVCWVLGRRYSRAGRRGPAYASAGAGAALLAGNGWAMSGGTGGSLALAAGAITAMVWVSAVALRERRKTG
jgi:hypothetical protein